MSVIKPTPPMSVWVCRLIWIFIYGGNFGGTCLGVCQERSLSEVNTRNRCKTAKTIGLVISRWPLLMTDCNQPPLTDGTGGELDPERIWIVLAQPDNNDEGKVNRAINDWYQMAYRVQVNCRHSNRHWQVCIIGCVLFLKVPLTEFLEPHLEKISMYY